jgi:mRNA-degrading endonuclease toxin of MazEF toxin-antitoxin module
MPLPAPEPGLVVCYEFLWADEAESGRTEGQKARPCIVVSVRRDAEAEEVWVAVVPLTHAPPADLELALEMPPILKDHLRLDAERSWVLLSEINYFAWPGHDLRQIPDRSGEFVYGQLPPGFYRRLIGKFRGAAARIIATRRD